nr:EOG090X0E0F [Eubosmina coregoni]
MEALVKLCAESLHYVLLGLCTRRGGRRRRISGGGHFHAGDADHKLYLESTVLERKIPEADLRQLIDLPPGLDLNEWLASHTIAFFEHINLLYGAISEYCTPTSCPDMLGPGHRQYTWIDERGKKIRLSAPQYIDYVMTYAQRTVNDESIFPTKFDRDFPATYETILRKIQRLLFHVVAHLYHRHFRELLLLGLHGHLHGLFAHLILFNSRFRLIDDKETEILHDLVIALRLQTTGSQDDKCAVTTTTTTTTMQPTASRSSQPSPTLHQTMNLESVVSADPSVTMNGVKIAASEPVVVDGGATSGHEHPADHPAATA